jgi:hypothetical protein
MTKKNDGPKFRKSSEWKAIERDNVILFKDGVINFTREYAHFISAFTAFTGSHKVFSELRYLEFVRSCSDDLYRYATYHSVKYEDNEFYIQESVRASYITKWLLMFKPLILDCYLSFNADKNGIDQYINAEDKEAAFEFFRKSNELFAIYFASVTLKLKKVESSKGFNILTDFFDFDINNKFDDHRTEHKDFLYTLRYRSPSQDVYRPIYRRLETMSII